MGEAVERREHDPRPERLVIAMTGATGVIYGVRLLETLRDTSVETHLVMSEWARRTIIAETDHNPDAVRDLADQVHDEGDLSAPLASGSFLTDGMVVAPCSMKSLAAIATGVSESLVHRAADVTLKEGRRLLLLVRETPLSVIHLENMLRVAQAGALVMPPLPAFYARPRSLDEMVDHTVGRVLDHVGVEHDLVRRWGEQRARATRLGVRP
ncbi:MAG TPA: UbiX family flavin prenyltransferase [Actinomycetes bacterium]|nr:UbiX family flavin prenyltransferase [Actinomycetes bacterium]